MATKINPGRIGAKRQSWSEYNPRELIKDAVRANPHSSEAEIRAYVWEIVESERSYVTAIFDYWFANNYRSFFIDELEARSGVYNEPLVSKHVSIVKSNHPSRAEIEKAKDELRPILMDQILSNGKKLRDATFKDCMRESGWLKEVSKNGKPTEVIGKHLTEKHLWNLRTRIFTE